MKRILMAAAIATVFTALPTMAVTFSGASLSNFQATLVDLDVNDGIAPAISFTLRNNTLNGFLYKNETNFLDSIFLSDVNISPTSSTLTSSTNTLTMTQSGDTIFNRVLGAYGNTTGINNNDNLLYSYFGGTNSTYDFTLSANTQVKFTSQAFNYLQSTPGTDESNEIGLSYARLDITAFDNIYIDENYYVVRSLANDPAMNLSELSLLSLVYDNLEAQEFIGSIHQRVVAGGNSAAKINYIEDTDFSVPVPAALPLMASALGLFGLLRRKNKVASI